ncbi:hypothetical protein NE237_019113 [Protea cynaroides]|uniref:Uncharacterized protein n=1 Tax=Protea cynaroides TaxID=273540 RepID=A0A9Q0KB96_9MAGN|nr:hypothetical protein NE237_019113 [Protea cynaroides]
MGFGVGLNLLFLLAMVATNILSFFHLSSSLQSKPPATPVPDHLIHQLNTIRATISHLTGLRSASTTTSTITSPPFKATIPSDLLLYAHLSPIASACHNHPDLLHRYMNYTPFSLCPPDTNLSEAFILRGCHPLPWGRCFSCTPPQPPSSVPTNPFPSLPDSAIQWATYSCKSFNCLNRLNYKIYV